MVCIFLNMQPRERMDIAYQSCRLGMANTINQFDAWPRLINPEAIARQDIAIAIGMQFAKAFGKLDFVAVDHDRTICALVCGLCSFGKMRVIDRQEPADAGIRQF